MSVPVDGGRWSGVGQQSEERVAAHVLLQAERPVATQHLVGGHTKAPPVNAVAIATTWRLHHFRGWSGTWEQQDNSRLQQQIPVLFP